MAVKYVKDFVFGPTTSVQYYAKGGHVTKMPAKAKAAAKGMPAKAKPNAPATGAKRMESPPKVGKGQGYKDGGKVPGREMDRLPTKTPPGRGKDLAPSKPFKGAYEGYDEGGLADMQDYDFDYEPSMGMARGGRTPQPNTTGSPDRTGESAIKKFLDSVFGGVSDPRSQLQQRYPGYPINPDTGRLYPGAASYGAQSNVGLPSAGYPGGYTPPASGPFARRGRAEGGLMMARGGRTPQPNTTGSPDRTGESAIKKFLDSVFGGVSDPRSQLQQRYPGYPINPDTGRLYPGAASYGAQSNVGLPSAGYPGGYTPPASGPFARRGRADGGMVARYAKGGKVGKVMSEYKKGELHSGSKKGPLVKNPKQAVAIALSEARKAGAKIPKKAEGGSLSEKELGGKSYAGRNEPLRGRYVSREEKIAREAVAKEKQKDMERKMREAYERTQSQSVSGLKKGGMARKGVPAHKGKAMYGGGKC